jgi:glycosyltransferase involved in cell wall biosynthesis
LPVTGVKTKVAEAISFGCPIVTTSLGADAADRHQIDQAGYVCDDPEIFAQHVSALLTNDDLWRAKQDGTRAVFDRVYSRRAAYGELAPLLSQAQDGTDHG